MSARGGTRGQPVVVLALLLGGWVALRTVTWQAPFAHSLPPLVPPAPLAAVAASSDPPPGPAVRIAQPAPVVAKASPAQAIEPAFVPEPVPSLAPWREPPPAEPAPPPTAPRLAVAHNLMFLAGLSAVPLPPELAALLQARETPMAAPFRALAAAPDTQPGDRWNADVWLLLREDTTSAVTSGRGSYGQSQLGAVLRYRLAPQSGFRPTLYARASRALGGARESEAALGFAARPVPGLPVSAATELRVTEVGGETRLRPAVYAVTELPRYDLPLGFAAEGYAQAGYVGGDFATGFADGQIRIDREVARLGPAELRAGGGAWGGAQKGAARLDIGPGATLALDVAGTPSRVSMDWRFRVAGEANPASGPTLTISAGF